MIKPRNQLACIFRRLFCLWLFVALPSPHLFGDISDESASFFIKMADRVNLLLFSNMDDSWLVPGLNTLIQPIPATAGGYSIRPRSTGDYQFQLVTIDTSEFAIAEPDGTAYIDTESGQPDQVLMYSPVMEELLFMEDDEASDIVSKKFQWISHKKRQELLNRPWHPLPLVFIDFNSGDSGAEPFQPVGEGGAGGEDFDEHFTGRNRYQWSMGMELPLFTRMSINDQLIRAFEAPFSVLQSKKNQEINYKSLFSPLTHPIHHEVVSVYLARGQLNFGNLTRLDQSLIIFIAGSVDGFEQLLQLHNTILPYEENITLDSFLAEFVVAEDTLNAEKLLAKWRAANSCYLDVIASWGKSNTSKGRGN